VGWLRDIGYEAVERIDLTGDLPISLITARRPGAKEGEEWNNFILPVIPSRETENPFREQL
jgi:hypothetical protein